MQARMRNPAMVVPGALEAIQALQKVVQNGGVPASTLALVHLRASQINGCCSCVDTGSESARKEGETDQRLLAVDTWRTAPYFTEAERAALAITEAVTRLADQADPVPDEVWNEAAEHFSESALGALILWISISNVFNRLNVSTRQVPGCWG